MEIYYCDKCGHRVPDTDITVGVAVKKGNTVLCAKCAAATPVEQAAPAPPLAPTAPAHHVGQRPSVAARAPVGMMAPLPPPPLETTPGKKIWKLAALIVVVVVCVAGVIVFLVTRNGSKGPEEVSKEETAVAATQPQTPAQTPAPEPAAPTLKSGVATANKVEVPAPAKAEPAPAKAEPAPAKAEPAPPALFQVDFQSPKALRYWTAGKLETKQISGKPSEVLKAVVDKAAKPFGVYEQYEEGLDENGRAGKILFTVTEKAVLSFTYYTTMAAPLSVQLWTRDGGHYSNIGMEVHEVKPNEWQTVSEHMVEAFKYDSGKGKPISAGLQVRNLQFYAGTEQQPGELYISNVAVTAGPLAK